MKKVIIRLGKKIFECITNISSELSAKLLFLMRTHKVPNLKNPQTFNEKLTFLKLNDYATNKSVIACADKYEVRKYVEKAGLKNILNELYGVYDSYEEIDFEKLPKQFALKCTHGCAYNIICDNKENLDLNDVKLKVEKWMNEQYGKATTELHYTKIKPKIIIEKYLCDKNGKMPLDYKFYCFNGKCHCVLVCSEREESLKLNYFDRNWKELDYGKDTWKSYKKIEKPKNLDKMIEISEQLSKEFPYVRVDLYNDNGEIIFGELTFTPACSCAPYYNKNGERELGKYLNFFSGGDVQILLSVMNEVNPKEYIRKMNIKNNYIIVNQIQKKGIKTINEEEKNNIILSIKEKGLSKSRNLAVKKSNLKIGVIADDDMEYEDGYQDIISEAYNKYPNADIIGFVVEHENKKNEKKVYKEGKMGFIKSMKLSSVQLTLNLDNIKKKGIHFDENFGSGSTYSMGEENIFLSDCSRKKMKMYYVPKKIGTLKVINDSNWFKGFNEKFFKDQGAVYYRMTPKFYWLLILQYALRKRKKYTSEMKMIQAIKNMFEGVKNYRRKWL